MGKHIRGASGPMTGKLGKTTTYILKGVPVTRSLSLGTKVTWSKQSAAQISTGLIHEFLSMMGDFIKFGFAYEVKLHPTWNYYNAAFKMGKKAIKGVHPKLSLDYSKMLLASGPLRLPNNIKVEVVPEGLLFTWDTKLEGNAQYEDLAMVLAYCPDTKRVYYIRSGAARMTGFQILPINAFNKTVEIYIAFISDDHSLVSDSLYLGQATLKGE